VAARTSAFRFRGRDVDIREIGRQLNVATVLEGSVRRAGTRLRITAQLLNVADGYHLWSDRYDRELEDIFAIQDDITTSIVHTLEPTLLGHHQSVGDRHSINMEAFELYLKGVHLSSQHTPQSLRAGVAAFEAAIHLDPNYALAQAHLAASYAVMHTYGFAPVHEMKAKTESAVARAMAHGPSLAESRFAMGVYTEFFTEAWETAEPHLQSAIELQPRGTRWVIHYALFLAARHRFDEAQAHVRDATALDPLSPLAHGAGARVMYLARRYNDAIQLGERALELHPDFVRALVALGLTHSRIGHHDRAIALFEKIVSLSDRAPAFLGLLGLALGAAGRTADAHALLDELRTRGVPQNIQALIHVGLGARDDFYADVRAATEQGVINGFGLEIILGPYLDDLAGELRFTELFHRNHLVPRMTQS
jgi:tetratricopeptide (TPR) repeat protein